MSLNMTEVAGAQTQGALASGIVEIAERLRRSSVLIGDGPGGRGGSGVIWESGANKSVIITNAHVVKDRRARVTLRDGQTSEGRVTSWMIGVISPRSRLRRAVCPWRRSVIPIIYGLANWCLPWAIRSVSWERLPSGLSMRAGNSGSGRTYDLRRAIPVEYLPTQKVALSGSTSMIANNLAFAVPSNAVKRFLARDTRPQLGIKIRALPMTQDGSDMLGLLVFEVESGSVAEKSGLMIGDAIVGTRERLFTDSNDLATALDDAAASNLEKLELSLIRGGKKIHWPVTFQITRPEMEAE